MGNFFDGGPADAWDALQSKEAVLPAHEETEEKSNEKRRLQKKAARKTGAHEKAPRRDGAAPKRRTGKRGMRLRFLRSHRRAFILGGVLAALIFAVFLFLGMPQKTPEGVIPSNVTIDGVDVSGMTREEAHAALSRVWEEKIAGTVITLTHAGERWTLSNEELGVGYDLDAAIDRALSIEAPTRFFDRFIERFKKKRATRELVSDVVISESVLRTSLLETCHIVDEKVVEGMVSFDPSGVDEKGLFTITAPRSGRSIDMTRLVADIRSAVYAGGAHEIALREVVVYPQNTLSMLKLSVSCIAEAHVSLSGLGDMQRKNAENAIARLNGATVEAGQNFSLRAFCAPYSGENGYSMVKDEQTGAYDAPGVSLVATLLYRAGLLADMKVLTRYAPETPVDYGAVGLDAAADADRDLELKNNSAYPIYIYVAVRDDSLYVALYGMPLDDGTSVSLQTQVLSYTETPQARVITDKTGEYGLAAGQTLELSQSHPGCEVSVYRVYIDKFGNEANRELISTDAYEPVAGVTVTAP